MLGDLGARVIKVERRPATTPARGVRRGRATPGRRPRTTRRTSWRQPQQGVDRPRPEGPRRLRRAGARWYAGPTCCWRTSGPACSTGSASPSSGCTSSTRGLVIGSITGFGHDGPEAAPGGLRPDRPGRGRPDVGDRHRAADQGRRPDRRPAGRDEPRVRRRWRRCTSGTRTGRGRVVRTSLLAGVVGVHAFQGTRVDASAARCRACRGAHHPAIAPYGMFATAIVAGAGGRGVARGCGGSSRRRSGWTPTSRASPRTANGSPTATS